ncbi:hypothetical protein A2Z41_03735 [Microgenomates group bacterium RBG_19FT_COMBO_39_10]|nr:MAG: hypothetical protein A2Z41_03735 [Microgenomates group bacterium RBG_19FT_COMBO_39_10]
MPEKEKIILEIRIPRENEYTPESAANLFSSFSKALSSQSIFQRILRKQSEPLILEIACHQQRIHFYVAVSEELLPFLESQILAAYPLAILSRVPDYLQNWEKESLKIGQMVQSTSYYYPIKTYKEFTDVDSLSSILAVMSKASENDLLLIQLVLLKASSGWQSSAQRATTKGIRISETERQALPGENLIKQKIEEGGLKTGIRIATSSELLLKSLAGGFAPFTRGDGNSLTFKKPSVLNKNKLKNTILAHQPGFIPRYQIFSVSELATIWHLPGQSVKIPNIAWGRSVLTEAPENLPIAEGLTEEQKTEINFFARTEYKNKLMTFGIKKNDRRRHIYAVGKSGTGKSTMIANMAIDDLKKRQGLAVIDPHGDLSEILLDYIPSYRINDLCYLNPADKEHPFSINILEVDDPTQAELVASGIVSIFYKLYAQSWGPRMEYILRNTLLTLAQTPNTTLVDVPRILTNKDFRNETVEKLQDQVLTSFWTKEYNKMPDKLREEAINPILNKVGQFVTSPLIRSLIGQPKSTINLERIMNEGKVIILNLSQGRLGEDNAALLGAMLITKIQLAAMNRVNIPEEQRRDFYLYVDEFQNFATRAFIKILSEARKYRLNLCLANQYMAQIDEDVQKAILGNAATLISFLVGAEDASILEREFGGIYTEQDLVGLSNFQVVTKLAVDNITSRPFFAYTLPLPKSKNQNKEKVIRVSRERFSYKK